MRKPRSNTAWNAGSLALHFVVFARLVWLTPACDLLTADAARPRLAKEVSRQEAEVRRYDETVRPEARRKSDDCSDIWVNGQPVWASSDRLKSWRASKTADTRWAGRWRSVWPKR